MIALYNGLISAGLTPRIAWRVAFVVVPVPILLIVASCILIFGTDHPAGKWSDRRKAIAHPRGTVEGEKPYTTPNDIKNDPETKGGLGNIKVTVAPVQDQSLLSPLSRRTYH